MEIKIMILETFLETKDLVFPYNTTCWKCNSCIKVISASTICSNKIVERIARNIMMSDIILCWHLTKEKITQGLYLHITNDLYRNLNYDYRNKRPFLSM